MTGRTTGATALRTSGVAGDAGVVSRLIATIDRGARPTVTAREVAQIVNYFARGPQSPTATPGQPELEMSAPAVDRAEQLVILRVSMTADVSPGAVARTEVDVDPRVVTLQRIGGVGRETGFETPGGAGDVTALYRLTLRRDLAPSDRIATIRTRSVSAAGKEIQSSERTVTADSAARDWDDASLRHRVATLAAAWGESLTGRPQTASQIATLAASLAREHRSHAPAQELARVTRAWADLIDRDTPTKP